MNDEHLGKILTDTGLAQFGDSLLNFAYSIALTETTGRPRGTKVQDKILADAAAKAGLRKRLPRRVGRGDVANSLEALLGHVWLQKMITLEEIVACLKSENLDSSKSFSTLVEIALAKGKHGAEHWIMHSQALVMARSGRLREARAFSSRTMDLARQEGTLEAAAMYGLTSPSAATSGILWKGLIGYSEVNSVSPR